MPDYIVNDPSLRGGRAWSEDTWVFGDGHVIQLGASGPKIGSGSGSPEGQKAWPMGSIWLRTDTSATSGMYVKQTVTAASTGWALK